MSISREQFRREMQELVEIGIVAVREDPQTGERYYRLTDEAVQAFDLQRHQNELGLPHEVRYPCQRKKPPKTK